MLTSLARANLGGTAGMIEPKKGMFDRLRLAASWRQINGPLFRKYVALFLAVVFIVLLTNVLFEVWFSYQEQKDSLIRIEREQAEAASPSRQPQKHPMWSTTGLPRPFGSARRAPAQPEELQHAGPAAILRTRWTVHQSMARVESGLFEVCASWPSGHRAFPVLRQ
jgi:hypothetical protein